MSLLGVKGLNTSIFKDMKPVFRFKYPTPAGQGLNFPPPGHGRRPNAHGLPGEGGDVQVPSLSVHYLHRIVDENQFYFVLIKNLCMSYTSQFLPYACVSFYSPTQSLCLSRFFFTSKMIGRTAIQSCPTYSPIRCERVPCVNHANHSRGLLSHVPFSPD